MKDVVLSHFFSKSRHRWMTRQRDVKTGRFTKAPKFYRFVWGVKGIPYEHESNCSAAFFYWNFKCDIDGKEMLLRQMERRLGYLRQFWWFNYSVGFGKQQVKFDEKLIGRKEFEFRRRR